MKYVRSVFLIALFVAAALMSPSMVPAGAMMSAQAASAQLSVVTTFNAGDFPESLAVDDRGNLYTSLGFLGEVVKVTPRGSQEPLAHLDVGDGLITGLALDSSGNLYVADATFQASPTPPGVFRIGSGGAVTRLATLPADSFPNGLAFHDGNLYVSDSNLGAIWRVTPEGDTALWVQDAVLAPKTNIGANGVAFLRDSLYVSVADTGSIVRVPVGSDGEPGRPVVIARANPLRTADGIAFDIRGDLYVAVNNNRLMRLAPDGTLTQLAAGKNGLAYPTMPAFGTTVSTRTTLYITNGAFHGGTPDIVAMDVGVRGLP